MKKIIGLLLIFAVALTLAACKGDTPTGDNVIYTTVYPMQYLVEEIGGDTVTVLRVPGSTTHSHDDTIAFSAKDQIDMINADLLFYVDAGVDTYIPNIEDTVFKDGPVELVNVSEFVNYATVCYSHDHDEEETAEEHAEEEPCDVNSQSDDPHFWLDPNRMLDALELVKDKLIVTYPENSEVYTNNYTVLKASLEKLDDDFQAMADEATKPIVTTTLLHNYVHEAYDIEIISLTTSVHTTEVDAGSIIEIVTVAVENDVLYIIFEKNSTFPAGEEVLTQLQEQVSTAQKAEMHGLGNLTQDEIDNGSTYLSIMYENLTVLENATK